MVNLDIQRQSIREAARAAQKEQKRAVCRDGMWLSLRGDMSVHMAPYEALQWMDTGARYIIVKGNI